MKNELMIGEQNDQLLSSTNDGTNRVFINGVQIPYSQWVGDGNYITTINGHQITIKKIEAYENNIILIKKADYSYELRKITLQTYQTGKDGKDGKDGITPQLKINNEGHLIAIYE